MPKAVTLDRRAAFGGIAAIAVAVAALTATGGFGQLRLSEQAPLADVTVGTLVVDGTTPGQLNFGGVGDLLPGRSTQRAITLENTSSIGLASIVGSVSVSGSGVFTGANGLRIDVSVCDQPWQRTTIAASAVSANPVAFSCPGSADVDGDGTQDGTYVAQDFALPSAAFGLSGALEAEDGNNPEANDVFIRAVVRWPSSAVVSSNAVPATGTLQWNFAGSQRGGVEQ
jgi:hypothetical protein